MLFKSLYEIVEREVTEPPVRFEYLREVVNVRHAGVGTIRVVAITYPVPNRQAHYVLRAKERSSAYEEEYVEADICYCEALDETPFDRRYALTKELMHVFDSDEERTDTREKFIQLMREVQNRPLAAKASAMFNSELDTRWMAAIILCPKKFRDQQLELYRTKKIEAFELAQVFQIPEWLVPPVMDDYYDEALATLLEKGA